MRLSCPPKLRAVPSVCHCLAGFLTGLVVLLISRSRKVKEAALETCREECKSSEPAISASSSQPVRCWILCAINDWPSVFLTCGCCRRSSASVGSTSSAGPAGCNQRSPAHGGWGAVCFSSSKVPPCAAKSCFLKALWLNVKTHFCPLALRSSLLCCRDCLRQPVPFDNHCTWASASPTFCRGLSMPCFGRLFLLRL